MMADSTAQHGTLLVLCGPAGVGKSTISRRLSEMMKLTYAVSDTTRPQVDADKVGKKYHQVSEAEFFNLLDHDEFLEYAQVHGHYYGTPKHPTVDQIAAGQDVLLEIDVQGALQVRQQYPDALLIFVLPPDEPTLLKRLEDRKRDTPEEISRRFRNAKREIQMAKGARAFDFWVVNDQVEGAVNRIRDFLRQHRGR